MDKVIKGDVVPAGTKVCVVVSRWNELVTKALLEGALDELSKASVEVTVVHVPGTWEIPLVIKNASKDFAGFVALGCILQGQTSHGTILGGDVSGALMNLQVELGKPIGYGILTPDTPEQALDRAGMKHGNKGREATLAMLEMVSVLRQL